jgi:serine phosphatase RsbU (regulator of sigma subunit)
MKFLTSISNYNVQEQKERLNQELKNWMKKNKQLDDILVMGIRILEKYGNVDLF